MNAWIPVGILILIIFTSLPLTPSLWNAGLKFFGASFNKIPYIIFVGIFMAFAVHMIRRRADFGLSGFLSVGVLIAVYLGLMLYLCHYPADRIHFAEYGVLAFLLRRAFCLRLNKLRANMFSLFVAGGIGILDECIQYFLPNRVFEVRDIVTNLLAAALGLALVAVLVRPNSRKVGTES